MEFELKSCKGNEEYREGYMIMRLYENEIDKNFDINEKDEFSKDETSTKNINKRQNANKVAFVTPTCVIYRRSGIIPHLVLSNEEYIRKLPCISRINLSALLELGIDALTSYSQPFSKVLGLEDQVLFCTVQDVHIFNKQDIHKYNEKNSVSVWTHGGRKKVTAAQYMNLIEATNIRLCESLCDTVPGGETLKRCKKSVDRTIKFLEECIGIKESRKLKNCHLFGVIEGGDHVKERQRSAMETAKRNVQGFSLAGFDQIGDNWLDILKLTLDHLPKDKPRILPGLFLPDRIIDAVGAGVDIFDNSYAYDATERGCAIVFEYSSKRIAVDGNIEYPPFEEKDKFIDNCSKCHVEYEISLHDKRYQESFMPLVRSCTCYACLNHTRAYINHLLITKEMLGQVLLMMHNTHHFVGFVQEIQNSLHGFEELRTRFQRTTRS